jgi:hypothetical protein
LLVLNALVTEGRPNLFGTSVQLSEPGSKLAFAFRFDFPKLKSQHATSLAMTTSLPAFQRPEPQAPASQFAVL